MTGVEEATAAMEGASAAMKAWADALRRFYEAATRDIARHLVLHFARELRMKGLRQQLRHKGRPGWRHIPVIKLKD